jgi:tRNA pseudouridine38-40 synthase
VPRTLKLTLAYDGTAYSGWQRQENAVGIQAIVEDELAGLFGARVTIFAAGRTDAGVHAAAQVVSLTTDHTIGCDNLVRAMNVRLPADIRVRQAEEMPERFNARRHAVSKTYRYAIWNGPEPGPFMRHLVWHVPFVLDLPAMQAAAGLLVGEHDFAAFQGSGSDVKTTVRRILASGLQDVAADDIGLFALPGTARDAARVHRLLRYEVTGTGFLRHMVRALVGTLVEIGRGRMAADDMTAIVASRDRARAGMNAPPHGLMLWEVQY